MPRGFASACGPPNTDLEPAGAAAALASVCFVEAAAAALLAKEMGLPPIADGAAEGMPLAADKEVGGSESFVLTSFAAGAAAADTSALTPRM